MRSVLGSATLEQRKDRVLLNASASVEQMKALATAQDDRSQAGLGDLPGGADAAAARDASAQGRRASKH